MHTKKKATREERFWAWLVDFLAFYTPFVAMVVIAIKTTDEEEMLEIFIPMFALIGVIIRQVMLGSLYGETIGKRYLGIQVINKETLKNAGFFVNVIVRRIVLYLPALGVFFCAFTSDVDPYTGAFYEPCNSLIGAISIIASILWTIDVIFIFQNPENQCLHDKIANTIVIKKKRREDDEDTLPVI